MTERVLLTAKLDSSAAMALRDRLLTAKDEDVVLDGSNVDFLGGLCLELLMSARHLWSAAGKTLSLETPSDRLIEDLGRFGVSPKHFEGAET